MPQIISFFLITQYLVIASIFKAKKLRVWILEAKTLTDPAVLEHWFQAKKNSLKATGNHKNSYSTRVTGQILVTKKLFSRRNE
jgi:hypothetical protein